MGGVGEGVSTVRTKPTRRPTEIRCGPLTNIIRLAVEINCDHRNSIVFCSIITTGT